VAGQTPKPDYQRVSHIHPIPELNQCKKNTLSFVISQPLLLKVAQKVKAKELNENELSKSFLKRK